MNLQEKSLILHEQWKGKIEVTSKAPVNTMEELSLAYTPGVAEPCRKISSDVNEVYKYTSKGNMVAIVTDGTAVLGLGDIGPEAGLPVMEGKAILFKAFGNVDAFPICLASKDSDEIVQAIKMIAPSFGGINIEDISSPRCVEIEERLKRELDIPVFHDDQHGTAVVVTSGLINALKVVGKKWDEVTIAVSGAGAAGYAIIRMMNNMGVKDICACTRKGILVRTEKYDNPVHQMIADMTNKTLKKGTLAEAVKGADILIGVSSKGLVTEDMVKTMAKEAIIFAMANPDPEIMPDLAKKAGAKVVGTGRSDFPNQVNNVLAFPGIFSVNVLT